MKKAIAISVILHVLLLMGLTFLPLKATKVSTTTFSQLGANEINVELVPTSEAGKNDIILNAGKSEVSPTGTESKCTDKTYHGIGIMISLSTWTITDAPEIYPAFKAGIRIGDVLVDPPSISLVPGVFW